MTIVYGYDRKVLVQARSPPPPPNLKKVPTGLWYEVKYLYIESVKQL